MITRTGIGVLFFSVFINSVVGHEGHHLLLSEDHFNGSNFNEWIHWIGRFHLVFIHFPIALIIMTVVAELLGFFTKKELYNQAARFMLYAAAIMAIPTVLFGFALGYGTVYEGMLADFYWWHRFFGIATLLVSFVTLYLKEQHRQTAYISCLSVLFILVNVTAFLGGSMVYGPKEFIPPFLRF